MGSSPYTIVTVVLFVLLGASCSVAVDFDDTVLSRICNGKQFTSDGSYDEAYVNVIYELTSHTPYSFPFDYYCQIRRGSWLLGEVTLYGHGACNEKLAPGNCYSCLVDASVKMFEECTHSIGAQIQLEDCRLRYENYKFTDDH